MSTLVLTWSIAVAQILLGLAMVCAAFRILRGPRAQDRVVGLRHPLRQRHAAASDFRHPVGQHALFRGGSGHRPARLCRHGGAWPNSCCAAR